MPSPGGISVLKGCQNSSTLTGFQLVYDDPTKSNASSLRLDFGKFFFSFSTIGLGLGKVQPAKAARMVPLLRTCVKILSQAELVPPSH